MDSSVNRGSSMKNAKACALRVIVATEAHFLRGPDGIIRSDTGGRGYEFWTRYLDVFSEVLVLARVSPADKIGHARVEGSGVSVADLPGYSGPLEYLLHRTQIQRRIAAVWAPGTALIARMPGPIGGLLVQAARRERQPYALELVGDPHEALASGAISHPLRRFFRERLTSDLCKACAGASAVAYVTEHQLQKRYPPAKGAFTTHFSSVQLPGTAFVASPRHYHAPLTKASVIHVGTQSQRYKGQDTLIESICQCAQQGVDVHLTLVGDGRYRHELERLAAALHLQRKTTFRGQLPSGGPVRDALDAADLFVMPSRSEGLPRAMIEAMARGLPCIGSDVGGIPELLPPTALVPPGNVSLLAGRMMKFLSSPETMTRMSNLNLQIARRYRDLELQKRRIRFYHEVSTRTRLRQIPHSSMP